MRKISFWYILVLFSILASCSGPLIMNPDASHNTDAAPDARLPTPDAVPGPDAPAAPDAIPSTCYDGVWYPMWECSDGCSVNGVPLQSTFQSTNRLEVYGQEAVLHRVNPSDPDILGTRDSMDPCLINWTFPNIVDVTRSGAPNWPDHCITYHGDLGPPDLSQTWCLVAP